MIAEKVLLGFAAALGAGLLVGIERERRKGTGPRRALAGVRTFTLAALAGAGTQLTGHPVLVVAGAALLVLLAGIGYWRERSRDPGITTEVALFVTYVIGRHCHELAVSGRRGGGSRYRTARESRLATSVLG